MTISQFKTEMLVLILQQAELLCEMTALEDIKIEPEQVRKNVASILALLTETEEFLKNLPTNVCSSSDKSISEE